MMVEKKPFKSNVGTAANAKLEKRRRVSGRVVIPEDEKQHLVVDAAYFRAARYRDVGADGCRKEDECAAAIELESVLKRHGIRQ